ncbi:hypothetical protein A2924_01320 [Candidatus Giovannonibacteria bacterium RIFCSPLOWO2_01_FULL_44_16]|uniref:Uncharacterized protein n=1 Tax=Candidatus Giovannonibacteria bacterium RIFCSPLOWO2_01_FULL_44_16 TaxID=1798348 RepID=A0A1F5X5I2_9BACT|nr:MAG: hypothetical protein A2924_01320 [Candidatus Giovannonibacteria bacterium RIFCSPLOWO2_01_FULL_44_16]
MLTFKIELGFGLDFFVKYATLKTVQICSQQKEKENIMEKIVLFVRNWLFKISGAERRIMELRESVCHYQRQMIRASERINDQTAIIVRYQDKCHGLHVQAEALEDENFELRRGCAEIEEKIDALIKKAEALDGNVQEIDEKIAGLSADTKPRVLH